MPKRTNDGIKKRCACGRRSWPTCRHPWWFGFHFNGQEHRYSLDKIARARNVPPPTSKSEAASWRDRMRNEIRSGTFSESGIANATADSRLTFDDVCVEYLRRHVNNPTRRPRSRRWMEVLVAVLRRADIPATGGSTVTLGSKPVASITRADVEAVRTWRRRVQSERKALRGAKGGECGTNRLLARLRNIFSWAIAEGFINETPFRRGHVTIVKLESNAESARERRLEHGEEERLLAHADPQLRSVIVAALTTGARAGELLSLQWSQLRYDDAGEARWMVLPAAKTKTSEGRTVPIGSALRAILEMRRHAPDGSKLAADAYVFGNEVGEQVKSIRPSWDRACRDAKIVDLHFHDLRREFACRLLESSADLHEVRDFLGHANITTTSRYLQSRPDRLALALARMERTSDVFAHHPDKPAEPVLQPSQRMEDANASNRPN